MLSLLPVNRSRRLADRIVSTSGSVVEGTKVYFHRDSGAWPCLSRKNKISHAKPSVKRRKSVFRDDGHCWLYIQGRTYTCAGLAILIIPARFSVFAVKTAERRKRDSGAAMT